MQRVINVGTYDRTKGLALEWVPGFEIAVSVQGSEITIRANSAGLLSLAQHLATLAQDGVPAGAHFHLDQYGGLEDGSHDLILERVER